MATILQIKKPRSLETIDIIVDDQDKWVSRWKWSAWRGKRNLGYYAVRSIRAGRKTKQIHLHSLIAGSLPGEKVEHLDGNSLNCKRMNLLVDGVCVLDLKDRKPITKLNYNNYLGLFL